MQSRWQVFLEQFGDPVVLLHEDDVHGREEGVLVHSHLSGHEVVNLFRLQKCSDWPDVQLQEEELRVGRGLQVMLLPNRPFLCVSIQLFSKRLAMTGF